MLSSYHFTTDQQFRLVDMDARLSEFLAIKISKGEALDEYVTREALPVFLQCIVDVFKGKPVKQVPMAFLINETIYQTLLTLKPVFNKSGQVTSIKGNLLPVRQQSALIKDVQETKDAQRGSKKAPDRSKNRPKEDKRKDHRQ